MYQIHIIRYKIALIKTIIKVSNNSSNKNIKTRYNNNRIYIDSKIFKGKISNRNSSRNIIKIILITNLYNFNSINNKIYNKNKIEYHCNN